MCTLIIITMPFQLSIGSINMHGMQRQSQLVSDSYSVFSSVYFVAWYSACIHVHAFRLGSYIAMGLATLICVGIQ